ncbi:MAG TPA: GerMN domain-containing protein [Chroococcales cyanobacterium]
MRKNRRRLRLVLATGLLIAAGLAWWIFRPVGPQSRLVELYYSDPQAMFLVPVTETVPVAAKTDPETVVSVVKALSRPPKGLFPAVPGDASPSAFVKDKVATVTLVLAPTGAGSEQLMANALAKAVGHLPNIEQVRLVLKDSQGRDFLSEHLDLALPLRADDPERENSWQAYGPSARVYWSTPDGTYLVPLQIPLEKQDASKPMESAFKTLLAGPASLQCGFLNPSVPPSSKPSFLGIREGIAEVRPGGTLSETAKRAIVLTLTEFNSVKAVHFEGEKETLPRPRWVNKTP